MWWFCEWVDKNMKVNFNFIGFPAASNQKAQTANCIPIHICKAHDLNWLYDIQAVTWASYYVQFRWRMCRCTYHLTPQFFLRILQWLWVHICSALGKKHLSFWDKMSKGILLPILTRMQKSLHLDLHLLRKDHLEICPLLCLTKLTL